MKFKPVELVGIVATSACFGLWLNNPFAGAFMLFLLTSIYLGVFRRRE